MIFSKSRPVKIVLVGTGGTGGYIVPQLYRLLYALDRPIWVILCDGDLVEEKNLGRQNFIEADLGKNNGPGRTVFQRLRNRNKLYPTVCRG